MSADTAAAARLAELERRVAEAERRLDGYDQAWSAYGRIISPDLRPSAAGRSRHLQAVKS